MGDWTGLAGAVLGAAVGFFAVRWQHHAQRQERILSKSADLLSLGDQYFYNCWRNDQATIEAQRGRLAQMDSIVDYLDIMGPWKLAFDARRFTAGTHLLRGRTYDEHGAEVAQDQFYEGRKGFVKRLHKRRWPLKQWLKLTGRYGGRPDPDEDYE